MSEHTSGKSAAGLNRETQNSIKLNDCVEDRVTIHRTNALRLKLSAPGDEPHRYHCEQQPLTNAFKQALESLDDGTRVECLLFPSSHSLQFTTTILNDTSPDDGIQSTLRSTPSGDIDDPVTDQYGRILDRNLDQEVEVEPCYIGLESMTLLPLATCRVAMPASAEPTPMSVTSRRPVDTILSQLIRRNDPFLYQVLITKTDGEYLFSVRFCLVDNALSVNEYDDMSWLYNDGYPIPVRDIYEPVNFRTNFDIPIDHYYESFDSVWGGPRLRRNANLTAGVDARLAYTGRKEYLRLLKGSLKYDDVYQKHVGYPKFPMSLDKLPYVLSLVSYEYDTDPWKGVTGRDPPLVIPGGTPTGTPSRADVIDDETLAGQSVSSIPPRQQRAGSSATEGSDGHEANLAAAIDQLEMRGYTIYKLDQEGSSVPDAIGINKRGEFVWLELEGINGKPENTLKNVSRAILEGVNVLIVVADNSLDGDGEKPPKDAAEDIWEYLRQPTNGTERRGTKLYNRSQKWTTDAGKIILLPEGADQAHWFIISTEDHWELRCYADGSLIASGPAEESVMTYDYDCPRYYKKDDQTHVIVRPDGTEIERASTKEEALDGWTRLQIPHLPATLSYAGAATVWYKKRDGLEQLDMTPRWESIDSKLDRYEDSVEEFLKEYTVSDSSSSLKSKNVHDWYKNITKPITRKTLPGHNYFGRVRKTLGYSTKQGGAGGKEGTKLTDRNWAYPPDIVSPDLPRLDEDAYAEALETLADDVDGEIKPSNPPEYVSDIASDTAKFGPDPMSSLDEGPAPDDADSTAAASSADGDAATSDTSAEDTTEGAAGEDAGESATADAGDDQDTTADASTPAASEADDEETAAAEDTDTAAAGSADGDDTATSPSTLEDFEDDDE